MGINSPLIRPHLPRQQGAGQDARHLGGAHLPPIQGREKGARATPCLTRGRRKGAQQSAGHPAWLAALCEASELGVMPAFPSLEHASCVVLWADLMTPPPPLLTPGGTDGGGQGGHAGGAHPGAGQQKIIKEFGLGLWSRAVASPSGWGPTLARSTYKLVRIYTHFFVLFFFAHGI